MTLKKCEEYVGTGYRITFP